MNVPHEDESFNDWKRKNNPMIDHLEELRPLMGLEVGDAVLVFVKLYMGLSYRQIEACESLYNLPRSKSAIEARIKETYKKLGHPQKKQHRRRNKNSEIRRDRILKEGFTCPECKRSVLAYKQPENCNEHDNE